MLLGTERSKVKDSRMKMLQNQNLACKAAAMYPASWIIAVCFISSLVQANPGQAGSSVTNLGQARYSKRLQSRTSGVSGADTVPRRLSYTPKT